MHSPIAARAFTLIELLVVVTIIVVLLALLLPAMEKAMASAESTVCLSNLRNWSLVMRQYSLNNKGQSPVTAAYGPRTYWFGVLAPYAGVPDYATRTPMGWLKSNICPSSKIALNTGTPLPGGGVAGIPLPGNTSYWGSASKVWQWLDPNATGTVGSYGMNLWLLPHELQSSGYPQGNFWGRYVNAPGDAPLLGDSIWIGGWPDNQSTSGDLPPADTENGNATMELTGGGWAVGGLMGRWVIDRHNLGRMGASMSFVDGTARHVLLGELWRLQWHKNFVPTDAYMNTYK